MSVSTALPSYPHFVLSSSFRAMEVGEGQGGKSIGGAGAGQLVRSNPNPPSSAKFGSLYSHCQVCGVMVPLKAGLTLGTETETIVF